MCGPAPTTVQAGRLSATSPRYGSAMRIETGQAAVVTGGTSGIGFALAETLVRRGVNVMIADIREDAIPVAVDALAGRRGHAAGTTSRSIAASDMSSWQAWNCCWRSWSSSAR